MCTVSCCDIKYIDFCFILSGKYQYNDARFMPFIHSFQDCYQAIFISVTWGRWYIKLKTAISFKLTVGKGFEQGKYNHIPWNLARVAELQSPIDLIMKWCVCVCMCDVMTTNRNPKSISHTHTYSFSVSRMCVCIYIYGAYTYMWSSQNPNQVGWFDILFPLPSSSASREEVSGWQMRRSVASSSNLDL